MVKDENLISIQYYLYLILHIEQVVLTVLEKYRKTCNNSNSKKWGYFTIFFFNSHGSFWVTSFKKKFFKNTFFLHWRITKLHFFWILEHYMIVGCSKFSISMTTKKGFKYITPNYTNKNIYSIIYYLQIYYILFQGTIRRVA